MPTTSNIKVTRHKPKTGETHMEHKYYRSEVFLPQSQQTIKEKRE